MKKVRFLLIFFSAFCFGQEAILETNPKILYPELYQLKISFIEPKIQSIGEKEIYFKKGKLKDYGQSKNEYNSTFEIEFKGGNIFNGRVVNNYGGHENTFSISEGVMNFSGGDVFKGEFFKGCPVCGEYKFANGDVAKISPLEFNYGNRTPKGTATSKDFVLKNGVVYTINSSDQKFSYKSADGTFLKSKRIANDFISGYTEFWSKDGKKFSGEISYYKPVGKWLISDSNGNYNVFFENDEISGLLPVPEKNSGKIIWGQFDKGKLIKKVKLLDSKIFCINGDCVNGEAEILVLEEPESGTDCVLKGNFKAGLAVGNFTAQINDANNHKYEIVGPLKNYKFHGNCSKTYFEYPIVFTGEYINGLPQKGNLIAKGELIEVTGFKNKKYIGKQTFSRSQNRMYSRYYEGEFNQYGQIEGGGTVYITDNNHWGYEGCKIIGTNWKDGYSGDCCFMKKNGDEDCKRVYFVSSSDFPDYNFEHPISQRNLAKYQQEKEQQRYAQEVANNKYQNEYQCSQCSGLGVIKVQCPMCKGAGYRKDYVTYNKYTGNTGGPATCSYCGGTGKYTVMGCSKCSGKGYVKK